MQQASKVGIAGTVLVARGGSISNLLRYTPCSVAALP